MSSIYVQCSAVFACFACFVIRNERVASSPQCRCHDAMHCRESLLVASPLAVTKVSPSPPQNRIRHDSPTLINPRGWTLSIITRRRTRLVPAGRGSLRPHPLRDPHGRRLSHANPRLSRRSAPETRIPRPVPSAMDACVEPPQPLLLVPCVRRHARGLHGGPRVEGLRRGAAAAVVLPAESQGDDDEDEHGGDQPNYRSRERAAGEVGRGRERVASEVVVAERGRGAGSASARWRGVS